MGRIEMLSYIPALSEAFCLKADDPSLAENIYGLFGIRNPNGDDYHRRLISIKGAAAPYSFSVDGEAIENGLDREHLLGVMDACFEAHLRSHLPEGVCAMHSAGAGVDGGAVAIVGETGVGKTTLALAMAVAGARLLGDEFAYLDLASGLYGHAKYPICLKEGSAKTLGLGTALEKGTKMTSPWGVRSEVFPFERILATLKQAGQRPDHSQATALPLWALIFPQRSEARTDIGIEAVPLRDLPKLLMSSVAGGGPREALLSHIIALAAEKGISLIALRYNDALAAAQALIRHLQTSSCKCSKEGERGSADAVSMNTRLAGGHTMEQVGTETAVSRSNGDVLALNETAGLILGGLNEGKGDEEIAALLEARYDIGHAVALEKVCKTAVIFRAHGVVAEGPKDQAAKYAQPHKPKEVSRRGFTAAAGIIGISIFAPSVMVSGKSRVFTEELLAGTPPNAARGGAVKTAVATTATATKVAPVGPYMRAMLSSIDPGLVISENRGKTQAADNLSLHWFASDSTVAAATSSGDLPATMESPDSMVMPVAGGQEIPVTQVLDGPEDLPKAYRTFGDLLGNPKAYELADCTAQILEVLRKGREQVSAEDRKTVYFGYGDYGLDTSGKDTVLATVFELIGANNAAGGLSPDECRSVDPVQIAAWDPDLVVLSIPEVESGSYRETVIQGLWGETGVLGSKLKVILTPTEPYPWLRQSCFTSQTLGALFVGNALYPEIYSYDMVETATDFCRMYLNQTFDRSQLEAMLAATRLKTLEPIVI